MNSELLETLKKDEGFKGTVYKCTEGFDTIGYGTRLPLTPAESELILKHRLDAKIAELHKREPHTNVLPLDAREALYNMCYQLGVSGVLKFRKMWVALYKFDYVTASIEMLDSRWAKQTPNRAKRVADKMRGSRSN